MKNKDLTDQVVKLSNLGGHPKFYELLLQIADLHARKNSNYSQDGNPLSNLKTAEQFNLPAHIGVLIRMADKWSRLQELAKGKKDLVGESMRDTLMDLAIYSLLCIIILEEEK